MNMIRFESNAGAPVTMDEDLAVAFIRMTGHQVTVPGAIVAEDMAEALAQLRDGLANAPQDQAESAGPVDDDDEPVIKLSTRAYPLLKLLEAADREQKDLLWDRFSGVFI